MKFNIKSKKGFTLIELLVVIGILAVLAAIAIPSVAGLIDRANQSSDATNSNEMTNAIERFASEYELYKQDIASGTLDVNNLDSAQGRVYNVTKVVDRNGITNLEKDTSAGPETTGPAIYRDTKYPVNAETVKLIIQNYTKTSSSTFEPKQSDMHYWYSPECGVVVVATPNSSVAEKNDLIISGMDAKGNALVDEGENVTIWIDITINITINGGAGGEGGGEEPVTPPTPVTAVIPSGGTYYVGVGSGNVSSASEVLNAGDNFPETPQNGDVYVYNKYEYRYNYYSNMFGTWISKNQDGWGVIYKSTDTIAPDMLFEIAGKKVNNLSATYYTKKITNTPAIPTDVINMDYTFACTNISTYPQLENCNKLTSMEKTFYQCYNLYDVSGLVIPKNVTKMDYTFGMSNVENIPDFSKATSLTTLSYTFLQCKNLKTANNSVLPPNLTVLYCTFQQCEKLTTAPVIHSKITYMQQAFSGCSSLTGEIRIEANTMSGQNSFYQTTKPIVIVSNLSNDVLESLCSGQSNVTFQQPK